MVSQNSAPSPDKIHKPKHPILTRCSIFWDDTHFFRKTEIRQFDWIEFNGIPIFVNKTLLDLISIASL